MFRADDAKVQGRLFPPAFNGIKDSQPGALSPWPWWRQIQPWANPYSFRSTLGKNTRACMHARIHTRIHTYTPTYMHACTTLHYVPLHYITIPYINLHYITLHYIHTHIHTYIHAYIHAQSGSPSSPPSAEVPRASVACCSTRAPAQGQAPLDDALPVIKEFKIYGVATSGTT